MEPSEDGGGVRAGGSIGSWVGLSSPLRRGSAQGPFPPAIESQGALSHCPQGFGAAANVALMWFFGSPNFSGTKIIKSPSDFEHRSWIQRRTIINGDSG